MEDEGSVDTLCHSYLPCSGTITSDLFLQVVYAAILGIGSRLISLGSEYLLEITSPGFIGGLVLPLLGSLPDAAIIIVSCLGGDAIEIQHKVTVGVGSLSGSNTFLITIPWALSLFMGRCDLSPTTGCAKNKTYSGWTWTKTGVSVMQYTNVLARIMMVSLFPYFLISIAFIISEIQGSSIQEHEKYWALSTSILCFLGFIAYSAYQMYDVRYQEKKLGLARKKFLWDQFCKHVSIQVKDRLKKKSVEKSFSVPPVKKNEDQKVVIDPLQDLNNNNIISQQQQQQQNKVNLIEEFYQSNDAIVEMEKFPEDDHEKLRSSDITHDKKKKYMVTEFAQRKIHSSFPRRLRNTEIFPPISSTPQVQSRSKMNSSVNGDFLEDPGSTIPHPSEIPPHQLFQGLRDKINTLDEDEIMLAYSEPNHHPQIDITIDEFTRNQQPQNKDRRSIIIKAVTCLVIGTTLTFVFADAFVESITRFSHRIGIPPFYISFIIAPFALNLSELVASYIISSKKKRKNISLVHSSLYAAVTMNNLIALGILLFMIYYRNLIWNFSAETLVIFLVTMTVGVLGSVKNTFNMIHAVAIGSLFPLSIALIVLLESKAIGWA